MDTCGRKSRLIPSEPLCIKAFPALRFITEAGHSCGPPFSFVSRVLGSVKCRGIPQGSLLPEEMPRKHLTAPRPWRSLGGGWGEAGPPPVLFTNKKKAIACGIVCVLQTLKRNLRWLDIRVYWQTSLMSKGLLLLKRAIVKLSGASSG